MRFFRPALSVTAAGNLFRFIVLFLLLSPLSAFSEEPRISREAVDILTKAGQAMAEVAAAVKPAVVNISTSRTQKSRGAPNPFFDDPLFRRFFGDDPRSPGRRQVNLGSGVIVDGSGIILTNNHVIKGAEEITVRLADKREFRGKIIGADPKSDIAVIRIDAGRLPVIRWGDSDKLRVGETVIAVGNPFGLTQTVTSGIVSAVGRANVGIADYEDFIQTDAPINPGNSGGALVNVRGELIGINTAIFSTSGGYQGIGFAIPSNMIRPVLDNLVRKGRVVRGWLGVSLQPVTPELAKHFKLKEEKGAIVGDVERGSPADKAGIRKGDVIVEFDGREIGDPAVLRNIVAGTAPQKESSVRLVREGRVMTAAVVVAELPGGSGAAANSGVSPLAGIRVQPLTAELRKSLSIPKRINGIIVISVDQGSPSEGTIVKDDIILEINRNRVETIRDFQNAVKKLPKGKAEIHIFRGDRTFRMTVGS